MTDYTDLQKAAEYAAQDTIKFADEAEEMRALQQFHEEVDPETVLALIAENEALREVMSAVVAEIPGAQISRAGNAPGHCHSVPGVWDRDNGAKAGKECAWCKVWNYAAAMGKGEQS